MGIGPVLGAGTELVFNMRESAQPIEPSQF
jgi:hypothetical protein